MGKICLVFTENQDMIPEQYHKQNKGSQNFQKQDRK